MQEYLCISIHFLGDTFHGRDDQELSEWPPSPLRLFQALVAANARCGNLADAALTWLEQQTAPALIAPQRAAIQPRGYRTYVPNNEGDLVAKSWSRGVYFNKNDHLIDISTHRSEKYIRPILLESSDRLPALHYLWPMKKGSNIPFCSELVAATRAVSQLGWGVDLVVADAGILSERERSQLAGEHWLPSEAVGGQSLRVPVPGTLAGLRNRYAAFLERISLDSKLFKPVPPLAQYARTTYRRASEMSRPPHAVFAIRKPDDSGFAAFSPTRRGLHLSGMMRHLASRPDFVAALGWDENKVATFVMGHGEAWGESPHQPTQDSRLVFIPLPSIEWRGETKGTYVGAIRRVLVTVKGHIANEEFNRIVRHLEGCELIDEQTGEVVAFLRRQSNEDGAINKYFAQSSEWISVTPIILPGYDDPGKLRRRLNGTALTAREKASIVERLEMRIECLLRKALRQAGYPETLVQYAELQWRGAGFMQGVDFATAYAVPSQHRRYRRLHVRITWRNAEGERLTLPGPHCIGGGRFTGLGLFVPAE